MSACFALCALLLAGCAEAPSGLDENFLYAKAKAAVAFAEAEYALSSHEEASPIDTAASIETPIRRRRLLYFTATWCSTCRANDPTLAALAAAGWSVGTSASDHIQIIDVDASQSLAKEFNVAAVPQWVLIEEGVTVCRASGVLDPFAVGRMFESKK